MQACLTYTSTLQRILRTIYCTGFINITGDRFLADFLFLNRLTNYPMLISFYATGYRKGVIDISMVYSEIRSGERGSDRGEKKKTRCASRINSARWGVPSEFWKRPWPLSGPSQTSERDPMVFGFIIAYLGRPRRIIAHEDPTRREIYGRARCNSPTETGRHSQINSGKRRHELGSPPARTHANADAYERVHRRAERVCEVNLLARELRRAVKLRRAELLWDRYSSRKSKSRSPFNGREEKKEPSLFSLFIKKIRSVEMIFFKNDFHRGNKCTKIYLSTI